jgi:hypothetical protein
MLAPGAKCPDCILQDRRLRESKHMTPASAPAARVPTPPPAGVVDDGFAKSPEEVEARDRAILDRLKQGPASFEQLVAVMPGEFASSWARESACRNCVIRLKAKGRLQIVKDGYAAA